MSLRPGTQLGPYTIGRLLAVGGMGEVYHARDGRIGRNVAVKILISKNVTVDQVRRFEQEAKAAGILNHPNILTVYDVGGEGESLYIVSELLQGSTLHALLKRARRLLIRQVIDFGMQIARGLDAAHRAGIIHRDLKPANLFITNDGRLKILDFGVAKLSIAKTPSLDPQASTMPLKTETGVMVGTVGYMSPEQLRGETIDHRSDLFSLGLVLYEMLCGSVPFGRASPYDVMHAIVHDDPPLPSASRSDVPAGLEAIILSCLAKNPDERFQSAQDVALALLVVATPSGSAIVPPEPARKRRATLIAGAAGVLAGIAIGALWIARPSAVPSLMYMPKATAKFTRLTYSRGNINSARFRPEGQEIVYSAAFEGNPMSVFVASVESRVPRPLDVKGIVTAILPRGDIGVLDGMTLKSVPIYGGAPRKLAGDVIAADAGPRGFAIERAAGAAVQIEYPIGQTIYRTLFIGSNTLRVSPDGQWIAILEKNPHGTHTNTYDVVAIDASGRKRPLSRDWTSIQPPVWTPDGKELWFTASKSDEPNELHAVTIEGRERLIARFPVAFGVDDIAPNGEILFSSFDQRMETIAVSGGHESPLSLMARTDVADLSRDGKIALLGDTLDGMQYTYTRPTDGAPPVRLSTGIALALSPDAANAIVMTDDGRQQLMIVPVGVGVPLPLPLGNLEAASWSASWFPDGKRIVFEGHEKGHTSRLYEQNIADGTIHPLSAEGVSLPSRRAVSPDGRWIIVRAPDVQLLEATTHAMRPAQGFLPGDTPMQWSGDGREVFVMESRDCPSRVFRVDPFTGSRTSWRAIGPADCTGVLQMQRIRLSDDGQTWVYSFWRDPNSDALFLARGLS